MYALPRAIYHIATSLKALIHFSIKYFIYISYGLDLGYGPPWGKIPLICRPLKHRIQTSHLQRYNGRGFVLHAVTQGPGLLAYCGSATLLSLRPLYNQPMED